ncbi:MAG: DNA replication and repair protein RecF [Pelolinea sp.]|nr:DNA replication and repair protein RecF [Pelolinea sp.]
MIIKHLSLTNFRAFKRLELDFPSKLNIFVGKNAQGKTSILEGIHLLSLLTSPIAGNDRQMINLLTLEDDIPVGRLVAVIEKAGKQHSIEVRLIISNGQNGTSRLRKEILIDGGKRKLLESVGYFNSVIFLPQMTRIIEDGPDERRKYLDRTISQAFPGYVRSLSIYNQAISRRNALLKQLLEQGGSRDQLVYWDNLIAENGAVIISIRECAVNSLNEQMYIHHEQLTHNSEKIKLAYQPSLIVSEEDRDPLPLELMHTETTDKEPDQIKEYFLKKLLEIQDEEVRRGVTTIGPHRDDMRFMVNDLDLGIYGSRGQIRTAVMTLKLAEMHWLEKKTGETPVLLLDETLAELDHQRRKDLLSVLEENSQSILTTTDLHLFDKSFIEKSKIWHIQSGKIE